MHRIRVFLIALTIAATVALGGLAAPSARAEVDVYTTPGEHLSGGRE